MDSLHSNAVSPEEHFDSMYFRPGGVCNLQDSTSDVSAIHGALNAFDFSFAKNPHGENKAGFSQEHTIDFNELGGGGRGPCKKSISLGYHPNSSEKHPGESLEVKYLPQTLHQSEVEQSNMWNQVSHPEDVALEFQQG